MLPNFVFISMKGGKGVEYFCYDLSSTFYLLAFTLHYNLVG